MGVLVKNVPSTASHLKFTCVVPKSPPVVRESHGANNSLNPTRLHLQRRATLL